MACNSLLAPLPEFFLTPFHNSLHNLTIVSLALPIGAAQQLQVNLRLVATCLANL